SVIRFALETCHKSPYMPVNSISTEYHPRLPRALRVAIAHSAIGLQAFMITGRYRRGLLDRFGSWL
ncbi:MAG TPA: hypothetical protein VHV10_02950, partial [Ktedonobacteraceae bacterium]|nr:hypothetical protein [Ktedonobacteraceae bacterium]